ncbi:MAG: efflux RND transporter permease subunit, partial [Pseudomonadota bacterium]
MFEAIIRNGILTTVAALIICVVGLVAALRVPVQMIPDLEVRTVSVETRWPGATPQDLEQEILIEQEEYLRSLPNLRRLESSASSGSAVIELDFPFGVDMTQTLIEVNNALNQVPSYPENVDEPRVYASSFSANSFMYFVIAPLPGNPRGLDMDMMRDFIVDHVRSRLSSVRGVSQVNIATGADRQIQVLVDPARLADRQLTISQVRNAIRSRNRDVSGGDIESGKRRYLLRTVGRFQSLRDLESLVIAQRGESITRLVDVAEIKLDHFEVSARAFLNGDPVTFVSVNREAGSNVIDIKYAMIDAVAEVNQQVLEPAGMIMTLVAEDAGYVEASIRNVWTNLSLGAVFAATVMFLFLRSVRATAVGIIGIPICTIAAFIGLLVAGRTINVISLAGVAFAIGMTLDNSIVVIESIEAARRRGLNRIRAAIEGVSGVWSAVLASTLTTILVFVPVLFIQEEAGQLYSDVAVAIAASIMASMLVAITLIPTASARLSFGTEEREFQDSSLKRRILSGIDRLLTSPRRRWTTIGTTVAVSGLTMVLLTPPAEYLPEGEEAKVFALMSTPPGYNLRTVEAITDEVLESLLPHVQADPGPFDRGEETMPPVRYLNGSYSAERLRIISEPVRRKDIDAMMAALTEKFRQYPGMRAFAARGSIISSNDGGTRSINLDLSGPDLGVIYAAADATMRRAEAVLESPRIQSTPSSLTLSQPLIEVHPDWTRAAELGLSAADLGYTVAALTDGAFVDEFFEGDNKIDIYLYGPDGNQSDLAGLDE